MKKFLFFDLDGTLADTERDIREAWKAALVEMNLSTDSFERGFVAGPTIEDMFKALYPNDYTDERAAELRRRFAAHYDGDGFPNTFEYPGVVDAVRELKDKGFRALIVTNKRYAGATAMAKRFGWNDVFESVNASDMYADDPAVGKLRKPQLLAKVLKDLGASADECVMIGDTRGDFDAAKANGIASVGVSWGYGEPEELKLAGLIVKSAAEMCTVLKEML